MANEGFLGKHIINGERASLGEHPPVFMHLPLSKTAMAAVIPVGTVLKRVEDTSGDVTGAAWEPLLSTDATTVEPVAVVESPCDPTGESAETSAYCVVHGGVKFRLLKTGDGKALTDIQIAQLSEHGIYPM